MTTTFDAHHEDAHHGGEHAHHPTGWRRYVYSTNHKDIGTMYLVFAVIFGCLGGFFSMMMRAELMYPGLQVFKKPHTFNVFVTGHGFVIAFFMIIPPLLAAFATCLLTLLIAP